MLRELITKPIQATIAIIELPLTARRSLEEVNQLMEASRRQLEAMQRQTDTALTQAERMNDLLSKVVRLTEPLERAQRGGEYVVGGIKQMIFGEEAEAEREAKEAEAGGGEPIERTEEGTIRVIPNRPNPGENELER